MEFLSKSEASKWLAGRPKDPRSRRTREFPIPSDAGRRVALVADLMRRFEGQNIVVVFSDWSVWPSGQRMHLFDRLRASYGETRHISDSPVHVFMADDFEDAVAFVTLGVLFLWDVEVFGKESIYFSHDEIGSASFNLGQWQHS